MNSIETEELKIVKNLINDIDFDMLEIGLKNPNFFRILKISKAEIRHSNFLSWLLNPYESHNLREAFLKRFLLDISIDLDLSSFENIEIRREWKNIDILIITDEIVVCIENKVESSEHSDQLSRYKKIIKENFPDKKNVFVYLTANQTTPSDNDYVPYSYQDIVNILESRILAIYQRNITPEVLQYLKDYIETLKLEIMQTHEFNKLVSQIYSKHKEALDFIFANQPDIANDFYKKFEKKVTDSGWVTGSINKGVIRFLTPKLKEILPQLQGYNQKESFVFEIDFYWSNQETVIFKTIIPRGGDSDIEKEIRQVLSSCMECTENAKKPNGKIWLVHFIEKHSFKLAEMKDKTDAEIFEHIKSFWIKITKIVNDIEKAILENESKILELKERQCLIYSEL